MALRQLVQPIARSLRCNALANAQMPQGLQGVRSFHVTAAARGGAGQPMPPTAPINAELPEEDELLWDDGSGMYSEGCLDEWVIMNKYKALAMLSTGLGFFGLLYAGVNINDKAASCPYPLKQFPFDNLSEELGGQPTRRNRGGADMPVLKE